MFSALQTANSEQLNYCLENYSKHTDLIKLAKELLTEKKSQSPEKQPITTPTQPIQEESGTSHYFASRLQKAFFNGPCGSRAATTHLKATVEATTSKDSAASQLAGLSFFTRSSEETEREKKSKLSFAAINH